MNIIHSAWKKLNVNSKGNSTGDCVIRGLCVAYGMDYDEVHSELNAIKRKKFGTKDGWAYNMEPVYEEFIRQHGCKMSRYAKDMNLGWTTTVEEFCKLNPTGTYLLLVMDNRKNANHILAVIDGDVYDSWNSLGRFVYKVYLIRGEQSDPDYEMDLHRLEKEVLDFLISYEQTLKQKMGDYGVFTYGLNRRLSENSLRFCINFATDCHTVKPTRYYFAVVLNPRISMDDNMKKILEKVRVSVREWAYALRKDIEDRSAVSTLQLNPRFKGTTDQKMLLMKMPSWARPLITYIEFREGSWYADEPYAMDMDALPGDPRGDDLPSVYFRGRNLTELRHNLEEYKRDFSRLDYDY